MVTRAQLQPDHAQEDFHNTSKSKQKFVHTSSGKVVNNQYSCRFVYSQSIVDLSIFKQEMSDTRATWKEWLTASDRCKPVIPGKSYAEVLKTDSQSQCMPSHAKNGVATQQGHPLGKLAGWGHLVPTKDLNISSDTPAYKNTTKVKANVTPDQFHRPVPVSNRFSPLYEVVDLNETSVDDTFVCSCF